MNTSSGRIANHEQAQAWNGDDGTHWAAHQDRYDSMSAAFTPHLFQAATIAATDGVLDIGCGCGHTTRVAARAAGRGQVLGIDLSAPMLERARAAAAAEGIANVTFEQADAQVQPFPAGTFDGAISRFGVMFFADPVAASPTSAELCVPAAGSRCCAGRTCPATPG